MAGQIERLGIFTSDGTSVEINPTMFPVGAKGKLKIALGYAVQMTIYSTGGGGTLQAMSHKDDTVWFTVPGVTLVDGSAVSFVPPAAARMQILGPGTYTVDVQYDMAT